MAAGYFWATYAGKGINVAADEDSVLETETKGPSAIRSFLPVVIPILLIAIKSFFVVDPKADGQLLRILLVLGDPAIALAIGVVLACLNLSAKNKNELPVLLQEGAEKSGGILVIIGAGGAFGAVLVASKLGTHLGAALPLASLGLFFPFLITCVLKTAQGSSTVAIITAASIVLPLLNALGLDSENGRLICVLAMGAGSMMISHANDAYFWVIAKFSGLDMKVMLRVYSVATLCMGLTSILMVFIIAHLL
jgi:GntP family gluconate:H+ symporter